MDVKEAVKWVFDVWHEWENVYGCDAEANLKEGKKMDEVIALLKQGGADGKELKIVKKELKKVWQMWGELEKEKCLLIDFDDEGYFKGQRKLDDIKQKYFPKLKCPKLPANFTEKVMKKIEKIKKGGEKVGTGKKSKDN